MATQIPEPQVPPQAPRASDPTIGKLVNDALVDVSTLVRSEIALAKAEVTKDAKKAGKAAAMFAGAGFIAVFGFLFLLHTIALGIVAAGLAPWLAYLIVTIVLLLIAGILALIGKGALKGFKGKPDRAIESSKETIDTVKRATSGETTSLVRATDPIDHGATSGNTGADAKPAAQLAQRS